MRTLLLGLVGACSLALLVSGAWAWQYAVHGIVSSSTDIARAVTVDAAGNVLAVGRLQTTDTTVAFTVLKFDGATGSEQRRQVLPAGFVGVSFIGAHAVTVDASGDVVAAGGISSETSIDFTVVKLRGIDGGDF